MAAAEDGDTPLSVAAYCGATEAVAALLGAAVNPTTALAGARGPLSPTTVKRGFG